MAVKMVYNRVQDCIVLLFGKHLTKMNRYDVFIFVKKDKFFFFVLHFFRIFVADTRPKSGISFLVQGDGFGHHLFFMSAN